MCGVARWKPENLNLSQHFLPNGSHAARGVAQPGVVVRLGYFLLGLGVILMRVSE